jgi:hypothetical protein
VTLVTAGEAVNLATWSYSGLHSREHVDNLKPRAFWWRGFLCPPFPAPIFLRLPPHCPRIRVLHLEPIRRAAIDCEMPRHKSGGFGLLYRCVGSTCMATGRAPDTGERGFFFDQKQGRWRDTSGRSARARSRYCSAVEGDTRPSVRVLSHKTHSAGVRSSVPKWAGLRLGLVAVLFSKPLI